MDEISSDNNIDEEEVERPLECSECRRPITVHYTEVLASHCNEIWMCSECPELQRRLQVELHPCQFDAAQEKESAGLACGNCGTTLASLRVGMSMGCSHCYELFSDLLIEEILPTEHQRHLTAIEKKKTLQHIGQAPGERKEVSTTLQLYALNQALSETLAQEDYEQAALLRDQIKKLTEENEAKDG